MDSDSIKAAVMELLGDVKYEARLVGETFRPDDWRCDQWSVTFTGKVTERFDYFTGIGNRKLGWPLPANRPRPGTVMHEEMLKTAKPVAPHAAEVLHSLLADGAGADQLFDDWCADFGYDSDSRKALATYLACQENAIKLRRVFHHKTLTALETALQDY